MIKKQQISQGCVAYCKIERCIIKIEKFIIFKKNVKSE